MAERIIKSLEYVAPAIGRVDVVNGQHMLAVENANTPEAFVKMVKTNPSRVVDNPQLLQTVAAIHLESVAQMHQAIGLSETDVKKNKEEGAEAIRSSYEKLHGKNASKIDSDDRMKARLHLSQIVQNAVNIWDNLHDSAKEKVAEQVRPLSRTVFDANQFSPKTRSI